MRYISDYNWDENENSMLFTQGLIHYKGWIAPKAPSIYYWLELDLDC